MYYYFFKTALFVVFANRPGSFSLCSVARLLSWFFNTELKVSQTRFSAILLLYLV